MSNWYKSTLSICIPCKNSAKYLGRMLDSLAAQRWDRADDFKSLRDRIEVVFAIEGGEGFQETWDMVLRWGHESGIAVWPVYTHTGSVGGARNNALSNSHLDYIAYFDSDDWLSQNDSLYNILQSLDKNRGVPCIEWYFDGPFPYPNSRGMCWLRAIRRDLAFRHLFPKHSDQEDREMYQGLLDDPEYVNSLIIPFKLYHYNFGRIGSISGTAIRPIKKEYDLTLFKKHLEEKKRYEQEKE